MTTHPDGSLGADFAKALRLKTSERTIVFIDGANLHSSLRGLPTSSPIDFGKLRDLFDEHSNLLRIFYYTALPDTSQGEVPIKRLIDWLAYNGFHMVTKATREFTDSATGQSRIKGNMDIELAIDMLEMVPHMDHAVLFSGDGDFRRLVEVVQKHGVKVTVIATYKSSTPTASDLMRRQADNFVDLSDIANASILRERGQEV